MASPQDRLKRIQTLYSLILKCNKGGLPANKKKLVAEYCCTTGCGRRRVLEYLDLLTTAEKVIEKGDGLWIKDGDTI